MSTVTSDELMLRLLQSAIYGEAIGDALGVPFEGKPRDSFTCAGMEHDSDYQIPAGTFSDDTSLTLATLDSLLHNDGHVDANDLRERYRDWLYDGKYTADGMAFGIGRTTYRALSSDHGLQEEYDNGNGSLMRSIPLAFFDVSDDEVRAMSAVTHAHEISMDACVRYVHAARALIHGDNVYAAAKIAGYDNVWELSRDDVPSSGFVIHTLQAALWCLTTTSSFRDCVLTAVNLGGDSDTTAAVAGALAGIVYGFEDERSDHDGRGIPGEWDDMLRGWRIIAEVICGGPLDIEDWDQKGGDTSLGVQLTPESAQAFGDDRCRAALMQADSQRRDDLFHEAARWFASGAELGSAQCATNLGVLYLYGHLQVENPEQAAMACFSKGASLGSAESACYLGDMYRDARGQMQDKEAARKCYEQAYALSKTHLDLDNAHDQPIAAMVHLRLAQTLEWELEGDVVLSQVVRNLVMERAYTHYQEAEQLATRAVDAGLKMYMKEVMLARAGMQRTHLELE